MKLDATTEAIIQAVIERAEQACRYAFKHQDIEAGPYRDGFETGCETCEGAIAAHVRRHIAADLCGIGLKPDTAG
jgi:hypothetical protein